LKRALVIILLLGGLVYAGDYLSLRFRIPNQRAQFGSVEIERSYAVKTKDGKTQYLFDQPEAQVCVHSLFPHFGATPCWYLERHTRPTVNLR
jgi:hypothetical protein